MSIFKSSGYPTIEGVDRASLEGLGEVKCPFAISGPSVEQQHDQLGEIAHRSAERDKTSSGLSREVSYPYDYRMINVFVHSSGTDTQKSTLPKLACRSELCNATASLCSPATSALQRSDRVASGCYNLKNGTFGEWSPMTATLRRWHQQH